MIKITVGCVLALLLNASTVEAQVVCNTSPCVVQMNKPFTAMADHDGVDTTGYRLYVNGQMMQDQPVTILANGVLTFQPVTLTVHGSFTIFVEAYGPGGATSGTALGLLVQPGKPKAPVNTRVSQGGS